MVDSRRLSSRQLAALVDRTRASIDGQLNQPFISAVRTVVADEGQTLDCLGSLRTPWIFFVDAGDELPNNFLQSLGQAIADTPHLRFVSFDEAILSERPMIIRKPMFSPDLETQIGYLSTGFVIHRRLLKSCLSTESMQVVNLPGFICLRLISQLSLAAPNQRLSRLKRMSVSAWARTSPHFFARHLRTVMLYRQPGNPVRCRRERSRKAKLERSQLLQSMGVLPRVGHFSGQSKTAGRSLARDDSGRDALIIIPTRDSIDLLSHCVESIWANTQDQDLRYHICVIDNGSSKPESLHYLKHLPAQAAGRGQLMTIVRDERPFDFAQMNNDVAFSDLAKRTGVLVFLNNDVQVRSSSWLKEMVSHANRAEVGCVGVHLRYSDGTCQHSGVTFEGPHMADSHDPLLYPLVRGLISNPLAVTGAAMAIRTQLFRKLGGFDPKFAVSYNDVDLCLRAEELGLRTVCLGHVVLLHHESSTRGAESVTPAKRRQERLEREAFTHRWQSVLHSFKQSPICP